MVQSPIAFTGARRATLQIPTPSGKTFFTQCNNLYRIDAFSGSSAPSYKTEKCVNLTNIASNKKIFLKSMQFLKLFIYETIFYSLIQEYISLGEAIFLKGLWY